MRVLVVEDSEPLRSSLQAGLANAGFAVDAAADGESGLVLARNNPYDVLVLDLLLPKLDGLGVLAGLRAKAERPHVLVLTARDRVEDRVHGLNEGADDYLVKPFAFDELLARIHALVRRRYAERSRRVELGALALDLVEKSAAWDGRPLDLTTREYAVLEYLALRRGHTVSREEIEDHVYGVHKLPSSNAVDSTVCLLRAKLGDDGREWIRTVRGRGYALAPPLPPRAPNT
jgi:two-component system copper resistance phosphate regulon response regulator CusR